ncbi:EAL domain-containing protein [Vibrio coralliilyticus]|uniref:EAL domain-containing protein n=1 Tax=Vibrio coralliilyticus TaxID=190893 RepID=UPI001560F20C|nr:EAL domain-containing protein [Vibrio coralliilyticus]NRF28132.1 EAL domain-containing protein [Vibrio coralliilyticus]NRF82248.1 EAL domain-containing protein [Vibrio coralliilyticus]
MPAALFFSIVLGSSIYWFTLKVSTEQFKRDYRQLFYQQLNEQVASTSENLQRLAKTLVRCDEMTKLTLRDSEFYDYNTRLLGWIDNSQRICTSRPGFSHIIVNFPQVSQRFQYKPHIHLSIFEPIEGRSQLGLAYYSNGKRWFALLEPWSTYFSFYGCPQCATITLGEDNKLTPTFFVGQIPINIQFHTAHIHGLLSHTAITWGVATSLLSGLLSISLLIWRFNWTQSPTQRLRIAIRQQEIKPYYQLIYDSKKDKYTHCEVLARWTHGENTMMPNEFIPLAESSGLIDDLLLSLMDQTSKMIQKNSGPCGPIFFSFNVSPTQLERSEFVEQLHEFYQFSASRRLALEITEREPFSSPKHAQQVLKKLSDHGYLLELDDAGTGYGSFSYIQELGFHILKIDKMFVDTIMQESIKKKVLDGIIEFGHTAQITMIAEGVEHKEQAQYLNKKGVHLHQGYYYSRPLAEREFLMELQQ